jgi:hypothetical protein
MKPLLLPLFLLSAWSAHSQITNPAPTPSTASHPSAEVCLEAKQAQVIQAALSRFERLKQAYAEKSAAYQGLLVGHEQDSLLLASNGRLVAWYKESYAQEQGLRQDATAKLYVRQRQATRRGLLAVVEALVLALLTYSLITN